MRRATRSTFTQMSCANGIRISVLFRGSHARVIDCTASTGVP